MEYRIKKYRVSADEETSCPCGAEVSASSKAFEILDRWTVLQTAGLCCRECAEREAQRLRDWDAAHGDLFALAA